MKRFLLKPKRRARQEWQSNDLLDKNWRNAKLAIFAISCRQFVPLSPHLSPSPTFPVLSQALYFPPCPPCISSSVAFLSNVFLYHFLIVVISIDFKVSQSRPLHQGKSPKPKKHEDVPSLDLQLSKSNEGLRELAKVKKYHL